MSSLIGAAVGVLLLGCGVASAQQAPSPLQVRVDGVARALENSPRLKNLSEQQRLDRVEFVIGNTLFALLHEMGHVVIDEMKLPILGREEDAADTYAAIRLLQVGTGFSLHALAEAARNWFLNERRDQQTGAQPLYYGEHSLNQQRAYRIVCLMVGSDPAKFRSLADESKMPQDRQESCKKDYEKASWSWDLVLKPHRRPADQPQTRIDVVYGDAQGAIEGFSRSFRAIRILEAVAQRSAADFVWPAPFTMEMKSCGRPEAAWDDKARNLRICYELAFDFAELYRAYVPAGPVPKPITLRRKRN